MPVNETLADEQWRNYTYCRDRGHVEFLAKADRCDNFFIGNQWVQEDLNALELSRRPAMTINKILATISTLLGEQINNRTEVLFRPSAGAPTEIAEALSKVWMQISQNNQLPWVRSDVFGDGLVRSRGFYDVRMDFEDNIFGEVRIAQQNSKNVVVDPDAESYDPDGWAQVFVTKWFTPNDIAVMYGKEDAELLEERGNVNRFGYDSVDKVRDTFGTPNIYVGNGAFPAPGFDRKNLRNIRVLDRQYRKLDSMKHFVDIVTGDMRPIPEGWDRDRIALVLGKMNGQVSVIKKLVKRVRWTVTADDLVLHDDWSPYKRFTIVPYFPHFRYGKAVGVVENLLGPQEILNKVSSQELHIVNTTANSGYVVEEDSLANMTVDELEVNGAKTGLVIEYRKGSTPPVKIQPNQPPSGLDRISLKAEEHIKTISNVSDSMLGFDRADVAAKAIAYKQQRGSVSMSKVLDNLERTDWLLARNVLDLIQQFYVDERIINITHEDFTREAETLTVNQRNPVTGAITNDLTLGEYDIVITSSPYRASLEDSQFEQARALRELGVPIPDAVLIENSRLLRRAEIVKTMQEMQNSPQAQAMSELNLRGAAAEVAKKEAEVGKTQANAEMLAVRAEKEAQPEDDKINAELALEKYKIDREIELEKYKLDREFELKRVAALRSEQATQTTN